ncbi:MAG: oligosaccharide flippase family protein [Bacteroidales bacterium]|nr:oligosaccharide flippase family protein [Candidatus Physcocola equi]
MAKISKLKSNLLFQNISSQGLLQLANYAIPILIIPFVTRALGPDGFGEASYAQNIAMYLTLLVNFGFEHSATQEVAIHKNDYLQLQRIFSVVVSFKFCLFLLSLLILGGLWYIMPQIQDNFALYFVAALFNLGWVFFPTWFFQGMERMAKMCVFSFAVKLIGALLIVFFVRDEGDSLFYLGALTAANLLVGVVAFCYILREYKLSFVPTVHFKNADVVRKGMPIFLNSFLVNCNLVVGVTIMGFYLTNGEIGVYSGAQKIIMAVMMITSQPITLAVFPRISRMFVQSKEEGFRYLKKSLLWVGMFSFMVSLAVALLGPLLAVPFLGEKFAASAPLLLLLSPLPFTTTIASTLTVQGLYGLQLQRFAPLVGIVVFGSNYFFNWLMIPSLGMNGAVYTWILCQVVEILLVGSLLYGHKPKNEI